MTSFSDLGLRAELVAELAAQGIELPFPIQEATIRDALDGRDVCGKAATGSGKTLAFGLPLLQRTPGNAAPHAPQALVLVPTRELARQVLDVLRPLGKAVGLRVAQFYGGTSIDRQLRALDRGVDVAVATPGRVIDLIDRGAFVGTAVEAVVVDEADRMADMGFLPQVDWILRRLDARKQTLLFSATLDGDVDVIIHRYLQDPVRHEVVEFIDEDAAVEHRFFAVHEMDRVKVLAAISRGVDRTIVFMRTKRGVDRLARQLEKEGVNVASMHGDLRQSARERSLKDFSDGKLPVLIATDVAARGIHVDNVDVVLHFDPPEDPKAYTHRSGRTARAGQDGLVVTFVLWNQEREVEQLQKRLRLQEPIIEVFSNDPRLGDVASLTGPAPRRKAAVS
jgi:superfamily II DNA/RNA helicase